MALSWPLEVVSHELIPVHVGWGRSHTVHIAEHAALGDGGIEAVPDATDSANVASLRSVEGLVNGGARGGAGVAEPDAVRSLWRRDGRGLGVGTVR